MANALRVSPGPAGDRGVSPGRWSADPWRFLPFLDSISSVVPVNPTPSTRSIFRILDRLGASRAASLATPLDLRRLIMGLALLVVLVTFANTFYAGYLQQREMLIRNTLESNQAYATKAAGLTDGFLQQALSQLGYSAQLLGSGFDSPAVQSAETRRLLQQNQTYNSVVIVNAAGKVLNISPPMAEVVGQQIGSSGMLAALQARQPLVSEPFVAGTGRLVIFISHPVFAPGGEYLGFIGGSVYLHDQNALHAVLGQHHFLNGSYLFVAVSYTHLTLPTKA